MALRFSEFAEIQKKRLFKSLAKGFIEQSIENEILNKSGNMEKYNYTIIEEWWRHLGTFSRNQITPFPFMSTHEDACDYLEKSDNWWDSLTEEQKLEVYDEFFDES